MPVSTVDDYLRKNMTQKQIQQINDYLDRGLEPKAGSSRELTESETKRQLVLQDQYVYDGLRPQRPMPFEGDKGIYIWI